MANTFTRKLSRLTGTSATTVGSYTVAANTTAVVVGLSLTNVTSSAISANVSILDNASQVTNLAVNAPISVAILLPCGSLHCLLAGNALGVYQY